MKITTLLLNIFIVTTIPAITYAGDCTDYNAMRKSCTPYTCTSADPKTGETTETEIVGKRDENCLTVVKKQGDKYVAPSRIECITAINGSSQNCSTSHIFP